MSRTNHHGDKKKAKLFNPWRWLQSTPGWWIRMMMTRPQRRKAHEWEHKAAATDPDLLDGVDGPPHGNKPHQYYW